MKQALTAIIQQEVATLLAEAGNPVPAPPIDLARPPAGQWGDFAVNVALRLAKPLKQPPLAIASKLAERLGRTKDVIAEVRTAPPGFVNISVATDVIGNALTETATLPDLRLRGDCIAKVLVDYSSVNIAKQMHVGHLRSTIIGDVLARVLEARGDTVIRQNHLGDWGLPMAMVVGKVAPMLADSGEPGAHESGALAAGLDLARLEELYREATNECKSDPKAAAACHELLVKLQSEDPQLVILWNEVKHISMRECYRIYHQLGVTLSPEHECGESFYRNRLADTVAALDKAGLVKESAGARCVFLPEFKGKDGAPLPVIVQKTDGGFNYGTFDLAAVRYRVSELGAQRLIYVTDARQALHFAQVFAVARAAGWTRCDNGAEAVIEHVPFGSVLGEDNKPLKTRDGSNVRLAELLDEAVERAFAVVTEKNADLPEAQRREVARQVGIGAVKYADLSVNRNNDYVFSFPRMLAMTGNTAPYLQYAHARCASVFRKAGIEPTWMPPTFTIRHPAERAIALVLLDFPTAVAAVASELRPHILCNYLYDLAASFSTFYDQCPVLTADDEVTRDARLHLCGLTRRTLARGCAYWASKRPTKCDQGKARGTLTMPGICQTCGNEVTLGRFCGRCGGEARTAAPQPPPPTVKPIVAAARAPGPSAPKSNTTSASIDSVAPSAPLPRPAPAGTAPAGVFDPGRRSAERSVARTEIESLISALRREPEKWEHYHRLAAAYLRVDRPQRALSTLRGARTLHPDRSELLSLQAQVLQAMGRNDEAIGILQRLQTQQTGDLDVILESTRLLQMVGRLSEALEQLRPHEKRATERPEILLRLAELHLALDDSRAAQAALLAYRKTSGETRDTFLLLGQAMMKQAFYDGAVKLYREASDKFPDEGRLHLGLGRALLALGDRKQAILTLGRAAELAPDLIDVQVEMGKLYGDMGMDEQAQAAFASVRALNPQNADAFVTIADYHTQRRWFDLARKDLERALEFAPHHPEVVRRLGEILENMGQHAEAIELYEGFAEFAPDVPWVWSALVRSARKVNDAARVVRGLRALIQTGERTVDAWCDLGEALIKTSDFFEANKAFEEAARIDPTCVRAYQAPELIKTERARSDGEQLAREGQEALNKRFFHSAIDKLDAALALVPNDQRWLRLLAEANLRLADTGRAAELLSRLRSTDSDDAWVNIQLARIYSFEEKPQLAQELLSSTLRVHPHELNAHIQLLLLRRDAMGGERPTLEQLAGMARHLREEFKGGVGSWVPLVVQGILYLLFGRASKCQVEALQRAEACFKEVTERFDEQPWGYRGLALVCRVRGENRQAVTHVERMIKASSDPRALVSLARLHLNIGADGEAGRCYASLKNLFPEDGVARLRFVELLARQTDVSNRNPLLEMAQQLTEAIRSDPDNPWMLYELACVHTMVAKRAAQRDEWVKRALLSWNRAAVVANAPPWATWGSLTLVLEVLQGTERTRLLNQVTKQCQRLVRELPADAWAHYHFGLALLGYDDFAQAEAGARALEKAVFLNPELSVAQLALARAYQALGKPAKVDEIRHRMLLLEPELPVP